MSDPRIDKYREVLQRSVGALEDKEPAEREAGYEKLRHAIDALLQKSSTSMGPEVVSMLHDMLEEMIKVRRSGVAPTGAQPDAEDRPLSDAGAPTGTKTGGSGFLRGALIGVAATLVLGAGLAMAGVLPVFEDAPGGAAQAVAAYEKNLPLVEVAEEFLERVREEVEGRQASDPDGLGKVAGQKFVPLKNLAPELAKGIPKALRSGVVVRADAAGYKILLNWPLCATVQFARPNLLDPIRAKKGAFGCSHFGVWNEAGAKW